MLNGFGFVGRILSRLSKDQDVMDNQLATVVHQVEPAALSLLVMQILPP